MASKFSCKCCGHCCEGTGGIVVSKDDLVRLCAFLSMTQEVFEKNYAERRKGKLFVRCGEDGRCIFFVADQGCAVHKHKPSICKAWPYFRGNLVDRESLELAKDFCPGIDPAVTLEEFKKEGLTYILENDLQASSPLTEARALYVDDLLENEAANELKNKEQDAD